MVSYKKLGLVNTKKMFAKAVKGGYAIPAFNFNTMEQMQAIVQAAVETKSPVIMQVSKGARKYANPTILRYMAEGAVQYAKELGCKKPQIVLHLDHGDSFETCKSCIDSGFSSVMIDGSSLPFKENIKLTKKVVNYAHKHDVTVEAELGVLAGVEDEVQAEESHYTKPEEVIEFATKTGCDSLAISIGTSHGAYKFKPEQCTRDKKTGKLIPPQGRREEAPRLPDRPPRLVQRPAGARRHDQQVRRQAPRRGRHSRGAAAQGGEERGVQDQHRLRLAPRDDGGDPQALRRASRALRPAPVPHSCARRDEGALHPQDRQGPRLEQQALRAVATRGACTSRAP